MNSTSNPVEAAPGLDCREQFRNRKRPSPWRYFLVEGLIFIALSAFFIFGCGMSAAQVAQYFAVASIPVALVAYAAWKRQRPVCPNCKKNIQLCRAVRCHVCGRPLSHARCDRCAVLQSWTHIFASSTDSSGNRQAIKYCPNCGALLETDFLRWLGGGVAP